jgi:hypothetical protein
MNMHDTLWAVAVAAEPALPAAADGRTLAAAATRARAVE